LGCKDAIIYAGRYIAIVEIELAGNVAGNTSVISVLYGLDNRTYAVKRDGNTT
jgi:hypothetical protein